MIDENNESQEFPVLVAQNGPLDGGRWSLDQTIMLGRDRGCDIVIPDRQVSRYHARLTTSPSGIVLEDLGSKNGTIYNNSPLHSPVVLQDGDIIKVAAAQEFMYLNSDATMPLEAATARNGGLMLDMRSRQVWVQGRQMSPPLSAPQFHLLWKLYENSGSVVTRQDLIVAVWGDEQSAGVSEQALDALIRRLRDRLAEVDPAHTYIVTVRGHGMRLETPEN
jgi:DNA-binding winged helix-turn-helix (wHTH) protein